jgi:hypothetical protein
VWLRPSRVIGREAFSDEATAFSQLSPLLILLLAQTPSITPTRRIPERTTCAAAISSWASWPSFSLLSLVSRDRNPSSPHKLCSHPSAQHGPRGHELWTKQSLTACSMGQARSLLCRLSHQHRSQLPGLLPWSHPRLVHHRPLPRSDIRAGRTRTRGWSCDILLCSAKSSPLGEQLKRSWIRYHRRWSQQSARRLAPPAIPSRSADA